MLKCLGETCVRFLSPSLVLLPDTFYVMVFGVSFVHLAVQEKEKKLQGLLICVFVSFMFAFPQRPRNNHLHCICLVNELYIYNRTVRPCQAYEAKLLVFGHSCVYGHT